MARTSAVVGRGRIGTKHTTRPLLLQRPPGSRLPSCASWKSTTQRTTRPNMTMESKRTRMTAHRLGGADDLDTARRSRTYSATSATPRARLSGISQKSRAATMDGDTRKNHTSDDACTTSVRAPIHVVQITTGRGLLRPGAGAASRRPGPRVTEPTWESSRKPQTVACASSARLGRWRASFSHHRPEQVKAEAGQAHCPCDPPVSIGLLMVLTIRRAPSSRALLRHPDRRRGLTWSFREKCLVRDTVPTRRSQSSSLCSGSAPSPVQKKDAKSLLSHSRGEPQCGGRKGSVPGACAAPSVPAHESDAHSRHDGEDQGHPALGHDDCDGDKSNGEGDTPEVACVHSGSVGLASFCC